MDRKMLSGGYFVDARLFAGCFFGVLLLSQIYARVLPLNVYFTFQTFLVGEASRLKYLSLAIRLSIPFIVGFLVCFAYIWRMAGTDDLGKKLETYFIFKNGYYIGFFAGGFFAAFVGAWPYLAYWEMLANPAVVHLKVLYFLSYFMYFLSYGYFCLAGSMVALLNRNGPRMTVDIYGRDAIVGSLKAARTGLLGFITSGLGTLALEFLGGTK